MEKIILTISITISHFLYLKSFYNALLIANNDFSSFHSINNPYIFFEGLKLCNGVLFLKPAYQKESPFIRLFSPPTFIFLFV